LKEVTRTFIICATYKFVDNKFLITKLLVKKKKNNRLQRLFVEANDTVGNTDDDCRTLISTCK